MVNKFPIQTRLVALAYIILLVSIFIPFEMNENVDVKGSYGLKKRIIVFLLMLFPISVSIYTINCLVVGDCDLWAWYNAILVIVWCCGVFLTALTNVKTKKIELNV